MTQDVIPGIVDSGKMLVPRLLDANENTTCVMKLLHDDKLSRNASALLWT